MSARVTLAEARRVLAARNPMPLEVRESTERGLFEVRAVGDTVWSVISADEVRTERRILAEESKARFDTTVMRQRADEQEAKGYPETAAVLRATADAQDKQSAQASR